MSSSSRAAEIRQSPVAMADRWIGVNDAVAAAMTRLVGSMPALYVVLVVFAGYMVLATWWMPLHRLDPYPFAFLLFLDNVAQLVLCLVILVGQRVLTAAADRRAIQTYENAEAIFHEVANLHAHLDRHDLALSRGVSLLESSPHPWIERHRVQPPPLARDQVAGVNDRIAARLTRRLGSVWAFYLAAATQALWIILAQAGIQRFDPYPFAFMTFLSTLAQLVFMIVIMVGQDVLGRAGDRRSEQTFLDAEAILHECRRMKARLTAQDSIIGSLTGYMTTQVTEQLAQAIHRTDQRVDHQAHAHAAVTTGEVPADGATPREWGELSDRLRQSYRVQARRIGESLAAVGCLMMPAADPAPATALDDDAVHGLARREYERRMAEKTLRRDQDSAGSDDRDDAEPLPWEDLPDRARIKHLQAARLVPVVLAEAGFQVLRGMQEGPTEADFTVGEWETLHAAMMGSGVLVALAEGGADPEEITALINKVRQTSLTHPRRFLRELTTASTFDTRLRADTSYDDYQGPALEAIRSATAIVARTAPGELADFRTLLVEIAETVADANEEGGFYGLGARRRYGNEAAAITAVRAATGLEHTEESEPPSARDRRS